MLQYPIPSFVHIYYLLLFPQRPDILYVESDTQSRGFYSRPIYKKYLLDQVILQYISFQCLITWEMLYFF